MLANEYKLLVIRRISSGSLTQSIVIIDNIAVPTIYLKVGKRVGHKYSCYKNEIAVTWQDAGVN